MNPASMIAIESVPVAALIVITSEGGEWVDLFTVVYVGALGLILSLSLMLSGYIIVAPISAPGQHRSAGSSAPAADCRPTVPPLKQEEAAGRGRCPPTIGISTAIRRTISR